MRTSHRRRRPRSGNWFTRKVYAFRRVFSHLSPKRRVLLLVWTGLSVLVIIAIATTIYFAASLGSKERIMNRNNTGVTLLDRNGKAYYSFYDARSDTYVTLANIAPVVQKAVVASEDEGFYEHGGFSLKGIFGAVWENIRPGGLDSGGSTITQQLVKNALLSQNRSLLRKYQEIILSSELDRRYSKDEILEMYLNSVYFGEGAFGIEDAAKTYFGKSAKDLNLEQATLLVGLIPAPSAYSPISGDPELAKKRQNYVLSQMEKNQHIDEAAKQAALATPLSYAEQAQKKFSAPHFALMVKEELDKKYGEEKVARSGYKVKTSINLDIQSRAEASVSKQVDRLKANKVSNGAAVVLDPKTGEILALVGSKDWYNTNFGKLNMATATRQPGSSFKPIVYATGIEQKDFSAATIWQDKATDFGGYKPKNYDLRFRGEVTTRRALANSLNIPAVAALQKAGINEGIATAKSLGLTTLNESPSTYGLSLALGSGQVRLTEMTEAYATFANGGERNTPTTITSISNKSNKEIFKYKAQADRAISPETAFIMSSMMSDNAARAETFGSALTLNSGRLAGVKTGTTEDYRDGWTIGFTPSLAVGVWVGNNDNSQMTATGGSLGAAPIWREIMNQTLAGSSNERFTQPSGIVAQAICRGNGALAEQPGGNTLTEYFLPGTLPSKKCNERPREEPKKPEEEAPAPTQPEQIEPAEPEEETPAEPTEPVQPTDPTNPPNNQNPPTPPTPQTPNP